MSPVASPLFPPATMNVSLKGTALVSAIGVGKLGPWGPIQLLKWNFQLSFASIMGHPVQTQLRIRLTFQLSIWIAPLSPGHGLEGEYIDVVRYNIIDSWRTGGGLHSETIASGSSAPNHYDLLLAIWQINHCAGLELMVLVKKKEANLLDFGLTRDGLGH